MSSRGPPGLMYSMPKSHLTDCRATLVAENDRKHDYIADYRFQGHISCCVRVNLRERRSGVFLL